MLTLKVPEMNCGHCAATIEKAVKSVDATAQLAIDLRASTVAIESKGDENAFREVIRSVGYESEKVSA